MPFQPILDATAPLAATTTTGRIALGGTPRTAAFQVRVKNAGAAEAFIRFGDSTVAATSADMSIASGGVEVFTISNPGTRPVTHVAAITTSGTAALSFTTGQGV